MEGFVANHYTNQGFLRSRDFYLRIGAFDFYIQAFLSPIALDKLSTVLEFYR